MRNANEEMTNDILTLGPKSQNSYLFIFLKISHYSFLISHLEFHSSSDEGNSIRYALMKSSILPSITPSTSEVW